MRKIKYTKDIAPVAKDFKRYKELKGVIQLFENALNTNNDKGKLNNVG